jgi:hypothetical protein
MGWGIGRQLASRFWGSKKKLNQTITKPILVLIFNTLTSSQINSTL